MRHIDEIDIGQLPFYGTGDASTSWRSAATRWRKRVQRLEHASRWTLRALYATSSNAFQPGICAQDLPLPGPLRDLSIERANQALGTDDIVAYIPMAKGFVFPGAGVDHGTGILAGCCHWVLEHPGYADSWAVSKRWRKLYSALKRRRSSIPTKGRFTSKRSPTCSRTTPLRSAWMARADGWTTCSSNVCGAASSTRTCTCGPTKRPPSFGQDWPDTSSFYNTRRRHSALDRRTPDAVYFDQAHRDLAA